MSAFDELAAADVELLTSLVARDAVTTLQAALNAAQIDLVRAQARLSQALTERDMESERAESFKDELAKLNADFDQRYRTLVDLHDRHVDLRAAVLDIHSWLADVETSSLTVAAIKAQIRGMALAALERDGLPDVV